MNDLRVPAPCRAVLLAAAGLGLVSSWAGAQAPVVACDTAGIGAARLAADGVQPTIQSVSTDKAGDMDYCLVKVLVPTAFNIWVGLPMGGAWNGRWQSVGGGERAAMSAKYRLASDRAVADCAASDGGCLTPGEAAAIDAMWQGAIACADGKDCSPPDVASRTVQGVAQTRPLCPYPAVARWDGKGSVDAAASFSCVTPGN